VESNQEISPKSNIFKVKIYPTTVELLKDKENGYSSPNQLAKEDFRTTLLESESSPSQYGEYLFDAIINDESNLVVDKESTLAGYRSTQGMRLGMALEIDANNMQLHEYPWELLRDSRTHQFLALQEGYPFYRRHSNKRKDPISSETLNILIVICNPKSEENTIIKSLPNVDIEKEKTILKTVFDPLAKQNIIKYEFLDESLKRGTWQNLKDALRKDDKEYHIVHLIAHGGYINNRFCLIMDGDNEDEWFIDQEKFNQDLMGNALRLVVLISCEGGSFSSKTGTKGIGPFLVELGIPFVVAMQKPVSFYTAQRFSSLFYYHLVRYRYVHRAMAATRSDLKEDTKLRLGNEWAIPVLFMGTDDAELFTTKNPQAENLTKPTSEQYEQVIQKALIDKAKEYGVNQEFITSLRSLLNTKNTLTTPIHEEILPKTQNLANLKLLDEKVKFIAQDLQTESKLVLPIEVYAKIASALNSYKHIILIGPPGTGKTSIAQEIADYAQNHNYSTGTVLTTATADWKTLNTIGGYFPTSPQTSQFKLGIFLNSICEGKWLIIDEINRAEIDKAFGELLTVLSGQGVELSWQVKGENVRILPKLTDQQKPYDYCIPPSWRIIGTMNVYDKSFFSGMSSAFMRRFAFIDIDIPTPSLYRTLLRGKKDAPGGWLQESNLDKDLEIVYLYSLLLRRFLRLDSPLMRCRGMGPAIIKDMLLYMGDRRQQTPGKLLELFAEAFRLYCIPQLDGLNQEAISEIYLYLKNTLFNDPRISEKTKQVILNRVQLLYPQTKF